jgi:hypothetical protein
MKTQSFFLILLALFVSTKFIAQTTEPTQTIAVANPNVTSLTVKTESAARMMRLELINLNKYKVYDEFDMADVIKSNPEYSADCFGQNCLIKLGNSLNTDYLMSGSLDLLGNKIAITLKIIDVKNKTIYNIDSEREKWHNYQIENVQN